jgi:hypothetical protein
MRAHRAHRVARFCAVQAASLALAVWTIPAAATSVPTHSAPDGQGIYVTAHLGTLPGGMDLLVDTGAGICTVPANEAALLLLKHEATRGPAIVAVLASGERVSAPTIFIDKVHLGAVTVLNAQAWVGGDKDLPALGLNVLRAFPTFGFTAHTLELGE